jgi:D-arabinose 1-dehydrogenase-like Zn-dependent alcohol dehydrogenase
MRAMAVVDYAAPLQLIDLPEPTVPDGWVLLRILACGVCYSDLKTARGHMPYSAQLRLPHLVGHEIAGEVVRAGPETGFAPGERVVVYNYWTCGRCPSCTSGRENLCEAKYGWVGFTSPGGFAELLAVPADRLLPLPDSISNEEAATISCALGTSYRAVVTRGRVQPGETVVILGVGGVGIHALQMARTAGARVAAIDVDSEKLAVAMQHGAAETALATEAARRIREITHGVGADVVVDTVGRHGTLVQAATLVRTGGRVVGVGYTVGQETPVVSDDFVLREITFVGSRYATRTELARVIALVTEGRVQPVVDAVLPLERANEALARLERGTVVGRVVLRVGDAAKQ